VPLARGDDQWLQPGLSAGILFSVRQKSAVEEVRWNNGNNQEQREKPHRMARGSIGAGSNRRAIATSAATIMPWKCRSAQH